MAISDSLENSNEKSDFTTVSATHQLPWVPNFIISNIQLLFFNYFKRITRFFLTPRIHEATTEHNQRFRIGTNAEATAAVQHSHYIVIIIIIIIYSLFKSLTLLISRPK